MGGKGRGRLGRSETLTAYGENGLECSHWHPSTRRTNQRRSFRLCCRK